MSKYFYSQGPGEQDPLHNEDSHRFLQVTQNTQMTSLCSSPRSSSASQGTTRHSDSSQDLHVPKEWARLEKVKGFFRFNPLHTWHNLSRSRNSSEQEACDSIFMEVPQNLSKRSQQQRVPRVSSPPEMLDTHMFTRRPRAQGATE